AHQRRDDLVGRHAAVAADRVAAHRERTFGPHVRIDRNFDRRLRLDADGRKFLVALAFDRGPHVLNEADEVAGADVAAAEAAGALPHSRAFFDTPARPARVLP